MRCAVTRRRSEHLNLARRHGLQQHENQTKLSELPLDMCPFAPVLVGCATNTQWGPCCKQTFSLNAARSDEGDPRGGRSLEWSAGPGRFARRSRQRIRRLGPQIPGWGCCRQIQRPNCGSARLSPRRSPLCWGPRCKQHIIISFHRFPRSVCQRGLRRCTSPWVVTASCAF